MVGILLEPKTLPWPVDWPALFGREAPLLVEIGFGGGHFLADLARRRPEANIIGVEISLPAIRRAQRKLQQAGAAHVRLLPADARELLWALCAPQTVAEVYINFPDPWPKAAHHHRRLIQLPFLHLLATRMPPGGLLEIATDHADYQQAILETLQQTPYFRSRLATPYVTADPDRLITKYEQIALNEGRSCHYYKWARKAAAAPAAFPVPEVFPMPHVVMQTPLNLDQIEAAYEPMRFNENGVHINLMEMFRARDRRKLLVEAYVQEDPVAQRVGLLIREREDGRFIITLHEVGFPRPTTGLRHAVGCLAGWLHGLHPETAITQHNLGDGLSAE